MPDLPVPCAMLQPSGTAGMGLPTQSKIVALPSSFRKLYP